MLTDSIMEEFERRADSWFQQQRDMEHDLHLAAELGKALLDRNTELEEALQQMYSTNQEQLQEIEYLTKQVEFLRQVNEQHTKVYEQLDVTARELEVTNQKLVMESKASENKIVSLTETVDGLQSHVDELQRQIEELKSRSRHELVEQRRAAQSSPCLQELYDFDRSPAQNQALVEERERLRQSVSALRGQLAAERCRTEELEQERWLVLSESGGLERGLSALHDYTRRLAELEGSVAELRRLRRRRPSAETRDLLDGLLFYPEPPEPPASDSGDEAGPADDPLRGHELTCIRRAEAVRRRGVSLLNEVDEQYSALQLKYNELLSRCQHPGSSSSKAVQTPGRLSQESAAGCTLTGGTPPGIKPATSCSDGQPEYKALFQEIFSCIQKTKEEIEQSRSKYKQGQWRGGCS
ncbi:cerebellar degeneration-related protein 2 [Pristis pectinata]|uniref:cerebellar degeneration-related protein 2 n=1 Tax=Pristis pectinata TaxID=685728 RepID=UPI00223DCCC5|nr:cerebellar degeneration-related protein 2 [Pristis pectinata]